MHVDFYELAGRGEDTLIATLRLVNGAIIPEPDEPWLHRVLAEPMYDPESGQFFTADDAPEEFLRHLHRQYRSAYLRASEAKEVQEARHGKSWDESKHPRGQPENAGEFAEKPGGNKMPRESQVASEQRYPGAAHKAPEGGESMSPEDLEVMKEAGISSEREASWLASITKQPTPQDLDNDAITLFHGSSLPAAKKIARDKQLRTGSRGLNAAATIHDAAQYPEETGAQAILIISADVADLSVDPVDQAGQTVEEGLFPAAGYGSSCTVGKHRVLAVIDLETETNKTLAWAALEKGNMIELAESGATVLYSAFKDASKQ